MTDASADDACCADHGEMSGMGGDAMPGPEAGAHGPMRLAAMRAHAAYGGTLSEVSSSEQSCRT
jgi:hypothetical protein